MTQHTSATLSRVQRIQTALPIAAAALIAFGATLLALTLAYIEDVALLARAPEAVWLFVCGVPTDSEMALPLLAGLGTLTLVVGVGMIALARWWRRSRRPTS
jgi:hypothetical protein